MLHSCKYLIVGGGMAADAAAHGIREVDQTGTITMLSAEQHRPYDRPPLSKKLWAGKPLDSIWRKIDDAGVDLRLRTRAVACDPAARTLTDESGNTYEYEKLLLATGGTPRRLPFADDGVIYYRDLNDYQRVRALADKNASFVIIGGGFIGSEIAAALVSNDCKVSMLFPAASIGSHIYPEALSEFLNKYFREKGVTVLPGESAVATVKSGDKMVVRTGADQAIECDAVIAGIGIEPDVSLAKSIGLATDNGITVDEYLRTTHPDIYAAGDVANFHSPALGIRRRVEHEDNANTMGVIAGRNMAGRAERYDHVPYFYSDLFDLGYEAVGVLDSSMDIVENWVTPYRKGVLYYLKDKRVRGVLLWNTWDQVEAARQLVSMDKAPDRETLKGFIPS
ncbi:MAG TPA: FAD-dependent oxidoreductase [Woeseiaceae bacterium]|nr:FAD-dependent oxidoreductase [Woeseiaceae bacterium]